MPQDPKKPKLRREVLEALRPEVREALGYADEPPTNSMSFRTRALGTVVGIGKSISHDLPEALAHIAGTPVRALQRRGSPEQLRSALRAIDEVSVREPERDVSRERAEVNAALHEAIGRRARGEPTTALEEWAATGKSLATAGYDATRAAQEAEGPLEKARSLTNIGLLLAPALSGRVHAGIRHPATPSAVLSRALRMERGGSLERMRQPAPIEEVVAEPRPRSLAEAIGELEEPHAVDIEAAPRLEPHARLSVEAPVVPAGQGTRIKPQTAELGTTIVRSSELRPEVTEALAEQGSRIEPHPRSFPDEPPPAPTAPRPVAPVPAGPTRRVQPLPRLPEEPGTLAHDNPLSQLDDHIAQLREELTAAEAELAAGGSRSADALRALPDEALEQHPMGRSPVPGERNIDLPDTPELDVAGATRAILERERRRGPIRPDDQRGYIRPGEPYEQQPAARPLLSEGERRAQPDISAPEARRVQPQPVVPPAQLKPLTHSVTERGAEFAFELLDDAGQPIGHVAGIIRKGGITTYDAAIRGELTPELQARVEAALREQAGTDLNFYRQAAPFKNDAGLTTFGTERLEHPPRTYGQQGEPAPAPRKAKQGTLLAKTAIKPTDATRQGARAAQVRYHIVDDQGALVGDAYRQLWKAKGEARRTTGYLYDSFEDRVYKVVKELKPKDITPNIPREPSEPEGGPRGEGGFLRIGKTPVQQQLSPAEVRYSQTFSVKGARSFRERWATWVSSASNWFHQKTHRTVTAFEVAEKRVPDEVSLRPTERPGLWAVASLDSPKRISSALEGMGPGRWDAKGNWRPTGTPSLEKIFEPIAGDELALERYRVYHRALHDIDIARGGKATAGNIADALEVVRGANTVTRKIAEQVTRWENDVLQYAIDAGGVDPVLAAEARARYPHYIPSWKVFDEGRPSAGTGGPMRPSSPFRKMKGSELPNVDPIEAAAEYGARMIRFADIIRPARSVADLAERFPDQFRGVIERIEAPKNVLTPENFLADALSDRSLALSDNTVRMWRNGQPEYWRVSDLMADALRGMGRVEFDIVTSFAGMFSGTLRTGVTANPGFGLANKIRDVFSRVAQSDKTWYPGQNDIAAFKDIFKSALGQLTEVDRFRAMGGGMGIGGASITAHPVATLAAKLPGRVGRWGEQRLRDVNVNKLTQKQTVPRAVVRTFMHPVEAFQKLTAPMEESSRYAEFLTQKKAGLTDLESVVKSQEHLTNFAMHGSAYAIRALSHATAFLNPSLQGLRTFGVSWRQHPGKTFVSGVVGISIPTLYFWLANQGDEEIQNLRRSPGGIGYWHFRPEEGGTIYRIPKPFLWGQLFGTALEEALDEEDPRRLERLAFGVQQQLSINVLPTLGYVGYGLATNKDPYFNVPLVPGDAARIEPGYQANRYTTELSKKIGLRFGVSPAKLEFAWRGLTGQLGRDALLIADRATGGRTNRPAPQAADLPDLGRFFARYPAPTVAPIRDLYDGSRIPLQKQETYAYLERHARADELTRYGDANQTDLVLAPLYEAGLELLSEFRTAIGIIETDPGMSPEDKRSMVDELLRDMIEQAGILNGVVAETRKSLAEPAK